MDKCLDGLKESVCSFEMASKKKDAGKEIKKRNHMVRADVARTFKIK